MPSIEGAHISGNVIVQPSVSVNIDVEGGVLDTVVIPPAESGWNLKSAVYDSVFFDVVGIDTKIQGVFFAPDAFLKAYFVGDNGNAVFEIDLVIAGTLAGAAYNSVLKGVSNNLTPTGMFIKSDGLRLYTTDFSNKRIVRHNLAFAWDMSGGGGIVDTVSTSGVANSPVGVWFAGGKMFVADQATNTITQWTVPTPGSLAGVTYDSVSFSVAGQTSLLTDLFIKPDGTKLYTSDQSNNGVYQFDLPNPNTLVGASFDTGEFFIPSTPSAGPNGVFLDPLGFKMWVADNTNDRITQYTLTN